MGFDSESEGEYDNSVVDSDSSNNLDRSRDRPGTGLTSQSYKMSSDDSIQGKMISLSGRGVDEAKIRLLEDAKDALLEAVNNMTQATERVDKLKIKYDKDSSIDKSSRLLIESVNGITKTCMLIEKIEIANKKSLRSFEQTERRINALELELRNQGDLASNLKLENT